MMVSRGEGVEEGEEVKGSQMYNDGRRLDLRW